MNGRFDPWVETLSLPKSFHLRGFDANLKDLALQDYQILSKSPEFARPRSGVNKALAKPICVNAKDLGNDKGLKPTSKLKPSLRDEDQCGFSTAERR